MLCKNCGTEIEDGTKFCPKCGNSVAETGHLFCAYCGTKIAQDTTFCVECGKKVSEPHSENPVNKSEQHPTSEKPFNKNANIENLSLWGYFLKCLKNYATFSGRARRKEYWGFFLFSWIFNIIALVIDNFLGFGLYDTGFYDVGPVYILLSLATFIPTLAVLVRRLHDKNESGWNLLWYFTGIGGILILIWLCRKGDAGENRYGPNPKEGEFVSEILTLCKRCQASIPENTSKCPRCGKRLKMPLWKANIWACLSLLPLLLVAILLEIVIMSWDDEELSLGHNGNIEKAQTLLLPDKDNAIGKEQGKLARIFTGETLGTTIKWFESQYGPAKYVNGDERTYKIDECSLTVRGKERINSLSLDGISPKCSFDLKGLNVVESSLPVYQMTFGMFEKKVGKGHYGADCLYLCGNAYDPSVWMVWEGSKADGDLKIKLEVVLVGDAAIDASIQWKKIMIAEQGEDWVIDTKFDNDHRYDNAARKLFKNVPITSITIGRD